MTRLPICTRLCCLDAGPIAAAIKALARGETPDTEDAELALYELHTVTTDAFEAMAKIKAGTLTQTEALAMCADEPCPPTQRRIDT